MTTKKSPDHTQQFSLVHVAPLGKLTAYTVLEHELDIIAAGSPANLAFNFAVALISIGTSFVLTLTTTTINSDRLFIVYVNVCMICLLAGIIMFAYWIKTRTSVSITVAKIKSRLIVPISVQEPSPIDSTTES
jgi:hypothetical protein